MKIQLALLLILFWGFSTCSIENGWKGIKVFETNRDFIEKRFGTSKNDSNQAIYDTEDSFIRVIYSKGNCADLKSSYGRYKLEKGIAMYYWVNLKKHISVSDLNWNKRLYKRVEDRHVIDDVHYFSREKGITITATTDENDIEFVHSISYSPTASQYESYKCEAKD